MTEISSIDSSPFEWESTISDIPPWKPIATLAWMATLIITSHSAYAAFIKKNKKTIQVQSASGSAPPITIEVPPEPLPPAQPQPPMLRPTPSTPTPQRAASSFEAIPCSSQDQAKIARVVEKLSKRQYLWPTDVADLEGIDKDLISLHPFKFLSTIFSNPRLRQLMWEKVRHDRLAMGKTLIPKGFIPGVNKGMSRFIPGTSIDPVEPYIDDFAAAVGTTGAAIRPLIQAGAQTRDWSALVDHLIEKGGVRAG